jgi:hypothetical protein
VWLGALSVAVAPFGRLGSIEPYWFKLEAVTRKLNARHALNVVQKR